MQYTANYNLKKPDYEDVADIKDINDNFDIVDTQFAAMKKYLPTELEIVDQEDATQKIQNALNNKGYIFLNIEGMALVGKLIIYSDTTLEVNGRLKLKDNVNDFMLENEHTESDIDRNRNIAIIGGEYDFNEENNVFNWTETFESGNFVAFGFNLKNIDNLKLKSNTFV